MRRSRGSTEPKITASVRRALDVVRRCGECSPSEFAACMWPDSPGWHRNSRRGRGSGPRMAGGAVLRRLELAGFARSHSTGDPAWQRIYALTPRGRALLDEVLP